MKRLNNRSLFTSYLLSYSGVVILSCTVISLIFINFYLRDLQSQQQQSVQEKANLALNDIENQFDSLYATSLKISIQKVYWPSYFKYNKYYEIELLEDFVQYQYHSSICNEYFLLYRNSDTIFHSMKCTKLFSTYMQSLGILDVASILNQLNDCEAFEMLVFDELELSFMLFPINTAGDVDAILCFVIYNTNLRNRIQSTTGGLNDSYSLYYKGNLLVCGNTSETVSEETKLLEAYSDNGTWHLLLDYSESLQNLSFFQAFSILLLVCAVVFLLIFAAYTAYKNYRPIKTVASQYGLQSAYKNLFQNKNELLEIDFLLQQFLQNASLTDMRLKNQQMLIREQMLRLLLNGDFTKEMENHLSSIHLPLPGPYYCVFVVTLQAEDVLHMKNILPDTGTHELFKLIEDLSDEEILLYPVKDSNHMQIVMLLSLSEEWQKEDAADMVKEILAVKGYSFIFGAGNVYDTMLRFPASYLDALSDGRYNSHSIIPQEVEAKAAISPNDPLYYDTVTVSHMFREIKQGHHEAAQQYLDRFIMNLEQNEPSLLILRYIFSDILSELVRTGRQIQSPISEQQISLIVTANTTATFHEGVSLIMQDLCGKVRFNIERINRDTAYKIISYIEQNCSDYDLTVEKIAGDLNIGINRVSQIIKQETGKSYKDYIICQRINLAKKLLLNNDLTVAEVCMQVGYLNISHFIKTFKAQVGVTPGVFRKKP